MPCSKRRAKKTRRRAVHQLEICVARSNTTTREMHTKYCTHCQGALRNTEILKWVAVAGAGVKSVWVACLLAFAASSAGAAAGGSQLDALSLLSSVDPSVVGGPATCRIWGSPDPMPDVSLLMYPTFTGGGAEEKKERLKTIQVGENTPPLAVASPSFFLGGAPLTLKETSASNKRGQCSLGVPDCKKQKRLNQSSPPPKTKKNSFSAFRVSHVFTALSLYLQGVEIFNALSLAGTAYGLHGFAGMFRSYPFSHAEESLIAEGTGKIGLSNDGPSLYIDFVDNMLFGNGRTKGKPHNGGCECSGCSPHFQGIRSSVLAARKAKRAVAKGGAEATADSPAR